MLKEFDLQSPMSSFVSFDSRFASRALSPSRLHGEDHMVSQEKGGARQEKKQNRGQRDKKRGKGEDAEGADKHREQLAVREKISAFDI